MGLFSKLMQCVASSVAGGDERQKPRDEPKPQGAAVVEGPCFAFLDVETPNRRNDRICSIGIIRTDISGAVLDKCYMLIDPEEPFDAINTSIHGITAADVRGMGTFASAWPRIESLINGAVVVAHNASFDLSVLDKCLAAYGIPMKPLTYACTKKLAGSQLSGLPNFKLDTVCEWLGIQLDAHHNAMADARACMEVFFALPGIDKRDDSWQGEYVPHAERGVSHQSRKEPANDRTRAQKGIVELCSAIIEDGMVTTSEAADLYELIKGNENLNGDMERNLLELLSSMLEDGTIDECEESMLLDTLASIVNPTAGDHACYEIDGKKFCLTGDFECGSKDEVTAMLEAAGGIPCKSVVKTCDFVIVGSRGSEAYAFGNYGTKVKKAMEWQAKGQPVKIASEHDFSKILSR